MIRAGADELRGLHHPLPEVPEPDDRDARSRLHLGDVEDRAEPGRDPAAEQAEPFVGQVALDREHLVRGHVHDLGVAADVARRADRLPVAAVGDVRPDPGAVERLGALVGAPDRAVEADAALRGAGHDHALADLDVRDARPDLDHLAHRGVPEDRRRDLAQLAAPVDAVGRAERRRARPDEHPPGRGVEVVDLLDHERLPDRCEQRRPH